MVTSVGARFLRANPLLNTCGRDNGCGSTERGHCREVYGA
ncbi:hypothetical protein chiPu_0023681, partial [Chiloscyllium punctatum]|nr:hypothetical protein [Chiloscyllium punctatum]